MAPENSGVDNEVVLYPQAAPEARAAGKAASLDPRERAGKIFFDYPLNSH
jgi:hypothetical protein